MRQEFAEIQEQVESAGEAADAKAEGAARLRAAEVRQAAEGITVEVVVQKISGLGLEIGKALADVSEQLTQEVNVLATMREAVALERKELEQLHKMDGAATALDQIVQNYAQEKQRAEAEMNALLLLELGFRLASHPQRCSLRLILETCRKTLTFLRKRVSPSSRQVQGIALKAIEGASGSKALSHVNQIAMEQAKNRPQA